jgi:hypothetical protein
MKSRTLLVILIWLAAQSGAGPREQMIAYLNGLAKTQLEARSRAVAGVRNSVDADRRKAEVRQKILRLIGGLPEVKGPVAVREFRKSSADGFRVEELRTKQPDWYCNVYIPKRSGPFPAIVLYRWRRRQMENWSWAETCTERHCGTGLRSRRPWRATAVLRCDQQNHDWKSDGRARRGQHR